MRLIRRLPKGFTGTLDGAEHVLAVAETDQASLVATALGLWVPAEGQARRIGWAAISKVTWSDGVLSVVEADEVGSTGKDRVVRLIADRHAVRFRLRRPGKLPKIARERVEQSIRSRYHKDLPGGGAWFVQRKLPGSRAEVLQVRPEPGTDPEIVAALAEDAADKLAGRSQ